MLPFRIADRPIASNARPELIELVRDIIAVDNLEPVVRSRNRPFSERDQVAVIANRMQTGPVPVFRTIDQSFAQRIAFDVSAHSDQRPAMLDRNRLESALVHGTRAPRPVGAVPSVGMNTCEPMDPVGNFFDPVAGNHKVPVIRHDLECNDLDLETCEGLKDHTHECVVVTVVLKQDGPSNRPIHHMKRGPAGCVDAVSALFPPLTDGEERKCHSVIWKNGPDPL